MVFKTKIQIDDVFTPDLFDFQFYQSKNAYLTPIWWIFTKYYLFIHLITSSSAVIHSISLHYDDWFLTPSRLSKTSSFIEFSKTSDPPFIKAPSSICYPRVHIEKFLKRNIKKTKWKNDVMTIRLLYSSKAEPHYSTHHWNYR